MPDFFLFQTPNDPTRGLMDIFNIGKASGTPEFFFALTSLESRLSDPNAYLTSDDLEILSRLIPYRSLIVMTTSATQRLFTFDNEPLPISFSRLISLSPDTDEIAFSAVQLIVAIIYAEKHYSVVVVDLVDRTARHFDSNPTTMHVKYATTFMKNLHRVGMLAHDTFASRNYFVQDCAQCGIFPFLIARELCTSFSAIPPKSRESCITEALDRSTSTQLAMEFRVELVNRINYALIVLYNARPGLSAESSEQELCLGSMCNRKSLCALINDGTISEQLYLNVFKYIQSSDDIKWHTFDVEITTITQHVVDIFVKAETLVLFFRHENRICYATCMTQPSPLTFEIAVTDQIPPMCKKLLGALQTVFNFVQLRVDPARAYGTMPASMPMTMYEWVKATKGECSVGTLSEKLHGFPMLQRRPMTLIHDIVYRQALAISLHTAYEKLLFVADCTTKNETSVDVVRRALASACCDMRNQIIASRQIVHQQHQLIQLLAEKVDFLIGLSKNNAPERWCDTSNVHTIRSVYYKTFDEPRIPKLMNTYLAELLVIARDLFSADCMLPTLETLLHPLLEELHRSWPIMIFHHDEDMKSVSPKCQLYSSVIRGILRYDKDKGECILFCPVALLHYEKHDKRVTFVKYIDIFEMQKLRASDEIMGTNIDMSEHVPAKLSFLGGRAGHDAFVTREWNLDLDGHRLAVPVFCDTRNVPFVLQK